MRGDVASFCVDLVLAGAGFGVLLAFGLKPRGGLGAVGAAGLAYLTGVAVVPLALTLLLAIGIPLTLVTFFAVAAVCVFAGAWRAGPSFAPPRLPRAVPWLRSWRSWAPDTWVVIAFVLAFGGFAVIGFLSAIEMPMLEGDGWTIWARKAAVLTEHDSLWLPFFKNQAYAFSHLDYPLQLPIWEAVHARAEGSLDEAVLLRHIWLLLVGFIWAAAYLLHVHGKVRPLVWAPILLLLLTAPAIWQQASGAADLPMAMFACLGLIAIALWLSRGEDHRLLALAAIMLAAAANTKNEGTAVAVAVLIVTAAVILAAKLERRPFLFAAGAVVAFGILPWRLWLSSQDIEGDIPISKGLNPSYLVDRIDRVWPSVKAINLQLAEQGRWVYLVPLAALFVLAALISGLGRRLAAFYLGAFAVVWAGFVWSYWISPYELSWHLETSVPRVVTVLVLIAAAAVLHLTGVFVTALERRSEPVNKIG